MMQKRKVGIALGCNLGDRKAQIEKATALIAEEFLENAVISPIFETAPWGILEQPTFYNAVIVGDSEWKSSAVLNYIKNLEKELGREKREKNGPREIDLDLLFCGEEVVSVDGVTVPHPGIASREFVLAPLCAVFPKWIHPMTKQSAEAMLQALPKRENPRIV